MQVNQVLIAMDTTSVGVSLFAVAQNLFVWNAEFDGLDAFLLDTSYEPLVCFLWARTFLRSA